MHGLLRRIRDTLHMDPHTAADIQQQQDVNRHVFAREIMDREHPSILAKNEVFGAETSDGAIAMVEDLGVYAYQRDVAAEDDVRVFLGGDQEASEGERAE